MHQTLYSLEDNMPNNSQNEDLYELDCFKEPKQNKEEKAFQRPENAKKRGS